MAATCPVAMNWLQIFFEACSIIFSGNDSSALDKLLVQ